MQKEKIQGQLFLENNYVYLRNFLNRLGENDAFSVCVKDIKTKKVCFYNAVCGEFWGLINGAMYGMTARDVLTRVPNFINVDTEIATIEQYENIAIQSRCQSAFQQVLLSYHGLVQARQSIVIPINGLFNRLIATAGIGLNVTAYIHPKHVLAFYRYYYPKRSDRVKKCCVHFGLNFYFYEPLSYEELRMLCVMVDDYRHKRVAIALKVSVKTVANYLAAIRDKLKPNVDVYAVLSALRSQREVPFEGVKFSGFKS